jgi:hypothetical protein
MLIVDLCDRTSVHSLLSSVSIMPNPSPLPTISRLLQIILDSARGLENPTLVTLLERTHKEIDRLSREKMPESPGRQERAPDLPLDSPSQFGEETVRSNGPEAEQR